MPMCYPKLTESKLRVKIYYLLSWIRSYEVKLRYLKRFFSKSIVRPNEIHIEENCYSEWQQKLHLIKMLLCSWYHNYSLCGGVLLISLKVFLMHLTKFVFSGVCWSRHVGSAIGATLSSTNDSSGFDNHRESHVRHLPKWRQYKWERIQSHIQSDFWR